MLKQEGITLPYSLLETAPMAFGTEPMTVTQTTALLLMPWQCALVTVSDKQKQRCSLKGF